MRMLSLLKLTFKTCTTAIAVQVGPIPMALNVSPIEVLIDIDVA